MNLFIFRDHKLNIALAISISWHLFCIFLVSPTLLPESIEENSTSISFLGSILDKVITSYEYRSFNLERPHLVEKLKTPGTIKKPDTARPEKLKACPFYKKYKENALISRHEKTDMIKIGFQKALIEGEAKGRLFLYKPEVPRISLLTSSFNSNYTTKIKFKITKHGFVEMPQCIVQSGSPEIDNMAIRYLRRWQFVPACDGEKEKVEGIISLSFLAK